MRERLLRETTLTLDKCVQACRAAELSKRDVRSRIEQKRCRDSQWWTAVWRTCSETNWEKLEEGKPPVSHAQSCRHCGTKHVVRKNDVLPVGRNAPVVAKWTTSKWCEGNQCPQKYMRWRSDGSDRWVRFRARVEDSDRTGWWYQVSNGSPFKEFACNNVGRGPTDQISTWLWSIIQCTSKTHDSSWWQTLETDESCTIHVQ